MPNRLAKETSPYLLQHRDNPVDWYPWGSDALERARREDKPILLSIGYAACHWCHVMEHESFEDEATAQLMNEHFVSVKVDREERPDIDAIYMQAVQALTGHGGWPMTVFLTPNGEPFYGGTYFPPEDRHGLPSFKRLLRSVAAAWATKRDAVTTSASQLKAIYETASSALRARGPLDRALLETAYRALARTYDVRNGGFGGAPKFPPTMSLEFLLSHWRRTGTEYSLEMTLATFRKMGRGGLYDQVGGGFHRYTVDAIWLVPHFEKMLYDNALLARFGTHLWQATGDAEVRLVVEETIRWLEREMTSPAGGFYSSLDADSEGHEGKFYVWSVEDLDEILGPDAELVKAYYGVSRSGNFEGNNILHVASDPAAAAARAGLERNEHAARINRAKEKLYEVRARRVWPGRDEKVLAGWNGLMLRALAVAARVFGNSEFRMLALRNAEFLSEEMVRDGRVMRSYKDGVTKIPGFLEDHAAVALGFTELYQLTFDEKWLSRADEIARVTLEQFWDDATGFFDTARDAEQLITRPRDLTDNALPSGNSLAVELLLRLADFRQDEDYRRRAVFVLETTAELIAKYPSAFGHLLSAADMEVNGAVEVALVGETDDPGFDVLNQEIARHYVPSLVLAGGAASADNGVALLRGRQARHGRATAYVCRSYACDEPVSDAAALGQQLERAPRVVT